MFGGPGSGINLGGIDLGDLIYGLNGGRMGRGFGGLGGFGPGVRFNFGGG